MNFRISKKKFYDALQIVSHAISPNSPQPALSGIQINVKKDGLTLIASDNDISIQKILSNDKDADLNLTVEEEGSIVIEAKYLLEIVRKIDSDTISVEIIDGALTKFKGQDAEYNINGIRSEDYPVPDFSRPETSFTLPALDLITLVDQTQFATSSKETRPVLTGVNFNAQGTVLNCIATDSYRLAKKTVTLTQECTFNATIPAKSLREVSSTIFNDKEVLIALNDKKVQFCFDETIIQSRLLDGAYPETERLIPSEFECSLLVDRDELIEAIDRTLFMKTENMSIIKMECSEKEIAIYNKTQEIGEFHQVLHADQYTGKPLNISFSGQYVLEACRALRSQSVKIQFTGEMKPFILTNPMDNTILQLVLPVRTYN